MLRRGRMLGRFTTIAIATATILAAPAAPRSRTTQPISFAQADGVIRLSAADALRLKSLAAADDVELSMANRAAMLMKAAPGLASSCDSIVNGWGGAARGAAEVTVRELGRTPGALWIAYRCASRDMRLRRYYTERMAALDPKTGAIRFFSLNYGEDRRPDAKPARFVFYHVAFAEPLRMRGAAAAASFFVYADDGSPGGGVAEPVAEDRLLIIAGGGASMRPVLSLLTMRKQKVSGHGGGAHLVTYRARLEYEHAADGSLAAIVAYRRAGSAGFDPARPVAIRYVWNPPDGFEPHPEKR